MGNQRVLASEVARQRAFDCAEGADDRREEIGTNGAGRSRLVSSPTVASLSQTATAAERTKARCCSSRDSHDGQQPNRPTTRHSELNASLSLFSVGPKGQGARQKSFSLITSHCSSHRLLEIAQVVWYLAEPDR